MEYPFRPKSNRFLLPGQFWAIPLENGTFACGRVIAIEPDSRTGFLTGLMDWIGDAPPLADDIKGCKVLAQGSVHIKTVHETGLNGMILGNLPLTEDNIKPFFFKSQVMFAEDCLLMRGYKVIGPASKEESEKYDVFSTWGYSFIKVLAETRLANEELRIEEND
ncbi:Imm26 family immunity protein [Planococcus sp. SE5232]|uniref:Imm26 family immunity protein n=1 Tax=unclassified Planococcus (in: firmicutes) TaxID=2662419 RepID=UPI003D6A6A93